MPTSPQSKLPDPANNPEFQKAIRAFQAMGLVGKKGAKIKVRGPEVYDGKKWMKADQFVEDRKPYFKARKEEFPDDETKIIFATSYLSEGANSWAGPILRVILGAQRKHESRNWSAFEGTFVKSFGDPDKEAATIRELETQNLVTEDLKLKSRTP